MMGAPAMAGAQPYIAAQAQIIPQITPQIAAAEDEPQQEEQRPVRRETVGGRVLWYTMKVIQQPERARACGSGPKSSADRRPVDPPPVVELRIFEGPTWEQARHKDITFVYNANFFLYATLEHARVLAHGRSSVSSNANTPPVLTGVPVCGMAYLDRPEEAGYFLFPDLSVRHEGRYRLVFSLYEETKEANDRTVPIKSEPDSATSYQASPAVEQEESFDYRDEIRSREFVVYSAKKFPGLAESTHLSKVVADQGCRVRIRRDVRMRRRDVKGGGDVENYGEEEYGRRRRTDTPDTARATYRGRSTSGSVEERTPMPADSFRRPSTAEYGQYQQPITPSSVHSHLGFLGGSSGAQFPTRQSFAHPSSVPQSPSHPGAYPIPTSYPPPPPPPSESSYPAPPPERPLSQSYASSLPSPKVENAPFDLSRRPSYISSHTGLPPLQTSTNVSPPSHSAIPARPGVLSVGADVKIPMLPPKPALSRPGPGPLDARTMAPVAAMAGSKRGRDSFNRDDTEVPRRTNGSRDEGYVHDDEVDTVLYYRRAEGQYAHKCAPKVS